MDRKWKSGAAVSPPTLDNASDGYASAGNPGTGTPATKPGPHWYHMITEELLSLITAAGLTPDKTSVVQLLGAANLLYDSQGVDPGGRLTLTTAVAVTTSDVSAATTVYYTPHKHDRIKLYDGTRWKWYTFTELSQALSDNLESPAAAAANKNYDMFVWDDANTVRCIRGPDWSAGAGAGSDTARGTGAGSTELEFFQGRWVNKNAITNGPPARRGLYVGTIRTDGSSQVNDTAAKRHVWNCFNRVRRPMRAFDTTDVWNYTTASYRQANANSANQLDLVVGIDEDAVSAFVTSLALTTSGSAVVLTAIGLDSTTTKATASTSGYGVAGALLTSSHTIHAQFCGSVGLGRHTLTWLESGGANVQFFGDNGLTTLQTGIIGELRG